ncbi:diguanylate cyclase [Rhizobium tubonense]|uniref:diguanylate cyclase n=1 Tax=Rhizobium tubonense TaxID=484088 RepID=UPI0018A83B14|nr:diguanylate cyclase [Rhizobium tubonense]
MEYSHNFNLVTMSATWQILIGNLGTVALVISIWAHLYHRLREYSDLQTRLMFGLVMGIGAIVSMILSVPVRPGAFLDLRFSLIAISAIFGGPASVLATGAIAIAYRLLQGGTGVFVGVVSMVIVATIGMGGYAVVRGRVIKLIDILALSITVGIALLVTIIAVSGRGDAATFRNVVLPAVLLNSLSIVIAALVLLQFRRIAFERDLLTAALTQMPDFHYVKNRESEFVIVNKNMATHNHFTSPAKMVGMTDFNLTSKRRAETLYFEEQELMHSGETQIDKVEFLQEGEDERWYSATKVPLRDRQGSVIGMAGVTRDITAERRVEQELRENRNMLSHAMAGMSDGFAMFDQKGTLVFCNIQYSNLFPLSGGLRVAGSNIKDILRKVVETNERRGLPTHSTDEWIDNAAAHLHRDKDEEIDLHDGRWLSLRTRLTADGMAIVVASDVTIMKQAEQSLRMVADQMKYLAETDGLTGTVNRRALDEAIATELAYSITNRTSLSVMMIDIDRFKLYNDTYGHLAGDQCLKTVSDCLRDVVRPDTDIVARFGGEEFVVLLPGSDEAVALEVARAFRNRLNALHLPHSASEFGHVTVSIGVSTRNSHAPEITASRFLKEADQALYSAKRNGRDQVAVSDGAAVAEKYAS